MTIDKLELFYVSVQNGVIKNMKIQVSNKMVPNLDAFSTVAELNFVLRIFGLSAIYRDATKLKYNNPIWKSVIFIITFVTANACSIYFKLISVDIESKFTFRDAIHLAYLLGYIQYIFDTIGVYKHGRQAYIDYFNLYDYIDSIMGMPYYNQAKKSIRNMCILYIFIGICFFIIELFTWIDSFNFVLLVELLYLAIRLLAALDVIANCVLINIHLETIGDILEYYYNNDGSVPGIANDDYDKIWVTKDVKKLNYLDHSKISSNRLHNMMRHLSRCYTLLVEQSDFLNLKYGPRVRMFLLYYL